ncbi:MAG TPA: L,D-transpeptidase family protein [Gaiellaceae bacterium]|nr:L,D-transpeptidase family protein [Gaiellaceae bacterium]
MSHRTYRLTRLGARAVTVTAFAAAILIGIEAAARAQEAGGQPEDAQRPSRIADGVTVSGVIVGGMTAPDARRALSELASRPLTVGFEGSWWRYAPHSLGAEAQVDSAVQEALEAPRGAALELDVDIQERKLAYWARSFARSFDERHRNARIVLRDERPWVKSARFGRELSQGGAQLAVRDALQRHERAVVPLPVHTVDPRRSDRDVGFAIVIKRASNRLILYRPGGPKGMKVARRFGVATGQPSYPTPLGSYEIVTKQRNPWWRPPDSDWAADAEPIPPGPGNPLGTRWMGISAPAVGIHGTPDAASIGYSASHGCIRMLVPEAEWLFERVEVGTPVYILDA